MRPVEGATFDPRTYNYGEMEAERTERDAGPAAGEHLALYQYPSCPFCVRVRRVIEELGIEVEMRDIIQNPQHRQDLVAARGRQTVPVLRITSAEGDRWMPESAEIVRWLVERYGSSA